MAASDDSAQIPPKFRLLQREAEKFEETYQHSGDPLAIDRSVLVWVNLLNHPHFAAVPPQFRLDAFNRAGVAYLSRYWARGELDDLNQALKCSEQAVALSPEGATSSAKYFNNLGSGLLARYGAIGEATDLEAAIYNFQQAVNLTPQDTTDLPTYSTNLGVGMRHLYDRDGKLADLEAAIGAFQEAVGLTPQSSPERPAVLNALGVGLRDRYVHNGSLSDLDSAVQMFKQAVGLTPEGSPDLPSRLHNLSLGLSDRYAQVGGLSDVEEAIHYLQRAVNLTAEGAPELPMYLSNLGNGLSDRYTVIGNPTDLENAIRAFQRAVDLSPQISPERPMLLDSLGIGLRDRYARNGNLADLESAIQMFKQAIGLTLEGSPDLPSRFNNFGAALSARYSRTGNLADLEAAVAAWQRSASLIPQSSPKRPAILTNQGTGLHDRYVRTGDLANLQDAIHVFQQAVDLIPQDSPSLPMYLANLGSGLRDRYARAREMCDLEAAIHNFQRAVDLLPVNSPDRPIHLTNLGTALRDRYVHTGNLAVLDAATSAFQQAIDLTSQDLPARPAILNNLGVGLIARYVHTTDTASLETAIQAFERAVGLTPTGSADLPMYLTNLANGLNDRYTHDGDLADAQEAIACYRRACNQGLEVSSEWALTSSRNWGAWALERAAKGTTAWDEAAEAYSFGLEAIERLFRIQLLRISKESWLREAQGLHGRAAYALARSGDPCRAVVTLEQGRARLLAEVLERVRADLKRLPAIGYRELYERFNSAAGRMLQLEGTEFRKEDLPGFDLTSELRAARNDLDATVEAIQRVPGYADLLRAPDFRKVKEYCTNCIGGSSSAIAAVYLTVTPVGGLALIVHPNGASAVWLEATEADLDSLLVKSEEGAVVGGFLPAQLGIASLKDALVDTLSELGKRVIQPLTAALDEIAPASSDAGPIARELILIPTGHLALLPLHAARYQKDGRERVFLDDFAVTYVPSARVLGSCCEVVSSLSSGTSALVAVGNPLPLPPELAMPLDFGSAEAKEVATFFENRSRLFCESDADRTEVEQAMTTAAYLHFACHGVFDPDNPLESAVILKNGARFTLADLYARPAFKRARLAVLSACQTAITDYNRLPEEAIGLPAGFLQGNVPGVVGSLWPVNDLSTGLFMMKFYEYHMKGDGEANIEPMSPIQALRRTQFWLRGVSANKLSAYFSAERRKPDDERAMSYQQASAAWRRFACMDPGARPFENPYYWAAFTLNGV
jgi:CHAT domain-containing protein/tetratricopeptide (TPR) repeat protein